MKNEMIVLVACAVGGMKVQGFKLSTEQESKLIKLLTSEKFMQIEDNLMNTIESDSKLVDAAIAYLEENL